MRTLTLIAATFAVALTATAIPTAADARGFAASHPRRAEVNGRLGSQNARIAAGRADGSLTASEAHSLRSNDRAIRGEERTMAANDGGHITRADQRSLNQQETANSRAIYADRHN